MERRIWHAYSVRVGSDFPSVWSLYSNRWGTGTLSNLVLVNQVTMSMQVHFLSPWSRMARCHETLLLRVASVIFYLVWNATFFCTRDGPLVPIHQALIWHGVLEPTCS